MTDVVLRPGRKSPMMVNSDVAVSKDPYLAVDDSVRRFDPGSAERALSILLSKGKRMRPSFSSSWVGLEPPEGLQILEYRIGGGTVRLLRQADTGEVNYHVTPDEYRLPNYQMRLVYEARRELSVAPPKLMASQGIGREQMRTLAEATVSRLIERRGGLPGATTDEESDVASRLSEVLVRYTAGLGVLEIPLLDPYVQDVYIDSPADRCPVHVTLGPMPVDVGSGKCSTNIVLSEDEALGLLSRLRLASGRPFSEAMPVLETDLAEFKTRVTVVGKPLSPTGVAIALRRHSTDPWTLLKFIKNRTITPLAAGLLWLLIDGRSTILIAGSRGAGKSSVLSALMLEFPQSQRILTIEDTLELPGPEMQRLGYKVQSLFVRSTLGGTEEMTADDALRVSLRLGESAIVLGEVRGREAKTLYEAMRSGSAGSSVLGTIHGNSPTSVFERIVYDLGIPAKAFNATDIVVICGLIRPGGGQRQVRRITSISEVVKSEGKEGAFRDLLVYDEAKDALAETPYFRSGSERLQRIADQWGMSYQDVLQNIEARAKIKHTMAEAGEVMSSARWNAAANAQFWQLVSATGAERDYEGIYKKWRQWFEARAGI